MSQPSSRHLSHDFAAWKGLSLRELVQIVIISTPVCMALFTLLGAFVGFPFAFGCVGLVLGFILAITLWPKMIAPLKAGKPYGYIMKQALLWMVRLHLKQSPWINYCGRWQKNKSVGVHHV